MKIEWDDGKNAANTLKHGISFERAMECDWSAARHGLMRDERYDYGEARFIALVPLADRLYHVVFTMRGDCFRVISFRKANTRERKSYGHQ